MDIDNNRLFFLRRFISPYTVENIPKQTADVRIAAGVIPLRIGAGAERQSQNNGCEKQDALLTSFHFLFLSFA